MRLLKYKGKQYIGVRHGDEIELRSLTKDDADFIIRRNNCYCEKWVEASKCTEQRKVWLFAE